MRALLLCFDDVLYPRNMYRSVHACLSLHAAPCPRHILYMIKAWPFETESQISFKLADESQETEKRELFVGFTDHTSDATPSIPKDTRLAASTTFFQVGKGLLSCYPGEALSCHMAVLLQHHSHSSSHRGFIDGFRSLQPVAYYFSSRYFCVANCEGLTT